MHASIALCVMLCGGITTPEQEITAIPLKEDLSKGSSIQDMERRERGQNIRLPQVPTLADPKQASSDGRPYGPGNQALPRSAYDPASRRPATMPQAPTEAGNAGIPNPWQPSQAQGALPRLPGSGGNGYYPSPASSGGPSSGYTPSSYGGFGANPVGYNNNGGYAAPRAAQATPVTTANNYVVANNGTATNRQYGVPSAPGFDPSKPFNNYQAPSGYSPWNNLTLPTNNGTTNPYTAYVRPAMEQQTFNSHISEQINGVQTQQRAYQGTPMYEMPVSSGAGLANPSQYIDYTTH
jgi:hypothetical protein